MASFNENSYEVSPRSKKQIRASANRLRKALGISDNPYFKPIEVIELVLDHEMDIVSFSTGSRMEMGNDEGQTAFDGSEIILKDDVYANANKGQPRGRFTAAHELGHWALHSGLKPTMARSSGSSTPAFKCSEWQANQFAAEVLMPFEFFNPNDTVSSVMARHGVSYPAATKRLKEYRNLK